MHFMVQYLTPSVPWSRHQRGTRCGGRRESQRGPGGRGVWVGMSIEITGTFPQGTPRGLRRRMAPTRLSLLAPRKRSSTHRVNDKPAA